MPFALHPIGEKAITTITPELYERAQAVANAKCRTMTQVVRTCIYYELDELIRRDLMHIYRTVEHIARQKHLDAKAAKIAAVQGQARRSKDTSSSSTEKHPHVIRA